MHLFLSGLVSNLDHGCLGFHGALGPQGLLLQAGHGGQQGAPLTNANL